MKILVSVVALALGGCAGPATFKEPAPLPRTSAYVEPTPVMRTEFMNSTVEARTLCERRASAANPGTPHYVIESLCRCVFLYAADNAGVAELRALTKVYTGRVIDITEQEAADAQNISQWMTIEAQPTCATKANNLLR
jgi:hypothetical protein